VTDFTNENLTGSRFEDVYLTDALFHDVDLTNAGFHPVDLTGVMIRGAALVNVDMSGEIKNVRVNGVDVVPLVEAELNRRYPDRVKIRPTDADGFREAWDILERLWQRTVERARGMAPELLHERVEGSDPLTADAGRWSGVVATASSGGTSSTSTGPPTTRSAVHYRSGSRPWCPTKSSPKTGPGSRRRRYRSPASSC
jgi:hypothetical protein